MRARRLTPLFGEHAVPSPVFLLLFSLILALPAHNVCAESPETTATSSTEARFVSPGGMNTGALLLKTEDGRFVEAPRLDTDVTIAVTGTIARTVVTQRFENPNDRWLEGIYVFPLPEQSAVDALRMEIGQRVIDGKIKTRAEARETYERAKAAGIKSSLVEQERPNIFTNSVANIGPHESVVIRIEYQETVKQDAGVYSLRFPLVVAPRYSPKANDVTTVDYGRGTGGTRVDPVPDRDRIDPPVVHPAAGKVNPVSLQVTLNAGFDLGEINSTHHEIALKRTGNKTATLALADGTVPADKDFELTWAPKAALAPRIALFHEVVGGEHYFLAMVTPPKLDSGRRPLARELIFVIDNSGSMAGPSIIQAKQSLLFALDRLRPGDKFNVIRFDDTMDRLFDGAVDSTTDNLAIAKHFVSRLDARGGTEMLPALKAALTDDSPSDTTRLRQIVFLTDGAVGNEAQLFAEIAERRGRSRLFTVGIGMAPNSHFMRRAAEMGRGTFTFIGTDAQVLERMTALFSKLERPVMVGLEAEWPVGLPVEAWPDPLPDLYAGEPVVVSAKTRHPIGELRLSGEFDGKAWSETVKLDAASDGAGVGKLWARNKIAALETKHYLGTDPQAHREIQAVALAHHLVSSETSLVAVDVSKSRPDSEGVATVEVPLNLPDGWVYDKVFGSPAPMQQAVRSLSTGLRAAPAPARTQSYGAMQLATAELSAADAAPTKSAAADIADPEAPGTEALRATPQPAASQLDGNRLGLIALLLAILSAVALAWWRYHRRDSTSLRRAGRGI